MNLINKTYYDSSVLLPLIGLLSLDTKNFFICKTIDTHPSLINTKYIKCQFI